MEAVIIEAMSPGIYAVTVGGRRRLVHYAGDRMRHFMHVDGETYRFAGDPAAAGPSVAPSRDDLRAPMPGLLIQVFVEEGQRVAPGDPLYVVEAMKMEHVVRAATGGRVTRVAVAPGTQVEGGAIVVEIEDLPEAR